MWNSVRHYPYCSRFQIFCAFYITKKKKKKPKKNETTGSFFFFPTIFNEVNIWEVNLWGKSSICGQIMPYIPLSRKNTHLWGSFYKQNKGKKMNKMAEPRENKLLHSQELSDNWSCGISRWKYMSKTKELFPHQKWNLAGVTFHRKKPE